LIYNWFIANEKSGFRTQITCSNEIFGIDFSFLIGVIPFGPFSRTKNMNHFEAFVAL
jgi:hypothetical protein